MRRIRLRNNRNNRDKQSAGLSLANRDAREALEYLEEIDAARADMRWWQDEMWALTTRSKRVRRAWKLFQEQGGVTAKDWAAFLQGREMRGCHKQHKHLRLVVKNRTRNPWRNADTGPSAA